jgi:hypothetical protein
MPDGFRHWWPALGVVTLTVLLAACGSGRASPGTRPAAASSDRPAAAAATRPYRLYTHCGIDEARIGNRYFETAHPLTDGAGNPPAGWGNPYQQGTMMLLSPSTAVFRDSLGHHVVFRLRPGATSFKHLCS